MSRQIVYVDSGDEQVAWLVARFGPQGAWSVQDQRLATIEGGAAAERAHLTTASGDFEVEFRDATPRTISFTEQTPDVDRTVSLETVMERAATFAADNPPHHPGSLPRFPVPMEHYGEAVGVPLPILAVDDFGRRGLYAPPRLAVVTWSDRQPVGVREFPGFDPEDWPPRRLGDWPTPAAAALHAEQLEATILRFSACWSRVIDAWFGDLERISEILRADVSEALKWRKVLDPPTMEPVYREMNPRFAAWIDAIAAGTDA